MVRTIEEAAAARTYVQALMLCWMIVLQPVYPAAAQGGVRAGVAPHEVRIRSLCPHESDRHCQVPLYDAAGNRIGVLDVDNQSGLIGKDIGRDLLEVQIQGKTQLIGRLGVVLTRQRSPVGRAVDCERVAGIRGSDCD